MRVGVLTTSYPRDAEDAAGAFVAGFSRWLAANVGDVDVVCADAARPQASPIAPDGTSQCDTTASQPRARRFASINRCALKAAASAQRRRALSASGAPPR